MISSPGASTDLGARVADARRLAGALDAAAGKLEVPAPAWDRGDGFTVTSLYFRQAAMAKRTVQLTDRFTAVASGLRAYADGMSQVLLMRQLDPASVAADALSVTVEARLSAVVSALGLDSAAPVEGPDPAYVATWWAGLTPQEHRRLIADQANVVGNLDGVAWADRDAANRASLAQAVDSADPAVRANAEAAAEALALAVGRGTAPLLVTFAPGSFGGDGAVAIATRDPARSRRTAVLVPGLFSHGRSAVAQTGRALDLAEAVGPRTAVVAWIGYDAPSKDAEGGCGDVGAVINSGPARAGGRELASFLRGADALNPESPLAVVGHSYGSTTASFAAADLRDDGFVDTVVLTGSPGAGPAQSADDLAPEVLVVAGWADPVTGIGNLRLPGPLGLGDNPAAWGFGAEVVWPADAGSPGFDQHQHYFDPGSLGLAAIAQAIRDSGERSASP